jgi:dihydrolipoamide dehydrogenase
MTKPDLVIIGGGPAGYTAALSAAKNGARVRLFEEKWLGGTCLHVGCIPTKTLLASTNLYQKIKKAAYFGITTNTPQINWTRLQQRKDIIVNKLAKALQQELSAHKIEIIAEKTTLTAARKQAPQVIIATGTSPRLLPQTLSTDEILSMKVIPKKIAIKGAGAVGLEMATLLRQLGAQVTVTEIADQVLPGSVSQDLAQQLQRLLEKQGIRINLNQQPHPKPPKIKAADHHQPSRPPLTLACIGRQFNNSGFAAAGLQLGPQGAVLANAYLQTNLPGVLAAGDITGQQRLAHVAYAQGRVAAHNAQGGKTTVNYSAVPFCVFTEPVLASVGQSHGPQTIRAPYTQLGIAQALGKTEGYLQLILTKEKYITGIQILGPGAAELIATATLIVQQKMRLKDLRQIIWAHPTLGEIFGAIL